MDRRRFLQASAGLLAVPRTAEAQAGKVWRIGFASLLTREEVMPWFRELEMGLRELGYIPDRNLQWEVRYAAGHPEQLQLVINLKSAKGIGVTMPQSLLLRANRVIE